MKMGPTTTSITFGLIFERYLKKNSCVGLPEIGGDSPMCQKIHVNL